MKHITIITPCYNEEENVEALYDAVKQIFAGLPQYTYEHIFADNASKDRTAEILRDLARKDKNVKVIINARNFGHIRSPYHALLLSSGDAVIGLVADFQDPPGMIVDFLRSGKKVIKSSSSQRNARKSLLLYAIVVLLFAFCQAL